jgi:glutamine synthetase adenylyltransferase
MPFVLHRLCGKARRQAVLPEHFLLAAIAGSITQTSRKNFAHSEDIWSKRVTILGFGLEGCVELTKKSLVDLSFISQSRVSMSYFARLLFRIFLERGTRGLYNIDLE